MVASQTRGSPIGAPDESHVEFLEWDSNFFGFPVGRVVDGIDHGKIASAVQEADDRHLRCVYLLVDAGDHQALDAAQEHGFLVRDIRVEMGRSVAGHRVTNEGLRRGRLDDFPKLQTIVGASFRGGRFFTDDGFPRERSTDLYSEWVRKGLACEPGWAAIVTNELSGFVVVAVDPRGMIGTIVLIGVSEACMGKGIGSILMAGAGKYFADNSLLHARVATQGHNVAALRLYQGHGYHIVGMRIWLHRWMSSR